jgi:hypothetical protein
MKLTIRIRARLADNRSIGDWEGVQIKSLEAAGARRTSSPLLRLKANQTRTVHQAILDFATDIGP